jgi:hypothetical protein
MHAHHVMHAHAIPPPFPRDGALPMRRTSLGMHGRGCAGRIGQRWWHACVKERSVVGGLELRSCLSDIEEVCLLAITCVDAAWGELRRALRRWLRVELSVRPPRQAATDRGAFVNCLGSRARADVLAWIFPIGWNGPPFDWF